MNLPNWLVLAFRPTGWGVDEVVELQPGSTQGWSLTG